MAADIASSLKDWSTNEANNEPIGSRTVGPNTDDNFRMLQVVVRNLASRSTIASAATCDLGGVDPTFLTVTGTTTITSLGTVSDGIWRVVMFGGALTLTHNATSLILPGAANITTAAGDVAWVLSLGSGNWRCLAYMRANGQPVVSLSNLPDGTVGAPSLFFTSDSDTGMYRIGTNAGGLTANGTKRLEWNANGVFITGEFEAGPAANIDVSSAGAVAIAPSQNAGFSVSVPAASNGNNAGSVSITAGQGAATTSNPGGVTIAAGAATSGSASGGSITLTAGNVPGGNNSVGGGDVILVGGNNGRSGASVHGDILLRPGTGDSSTHNGLVKVQAGTTLVAQVSTVTHAMTFGTAKTPNISSGGGSGATISGNPNAFKVTLGTGPSATLVITFDEDWTNPPIVIPRYQTADINVRASSISVSAVTFTFASSPASGGVLDVMCFGHE